MPGRFCLLYLSITSFGRFSQRSKIEPEKPSSRLRCVGNSFGNENSSQRLKEAPFCFGIFLPATRSRTARRNFSRSAGLSMSRFKLHRLRDGFSVSNALLFGQSLPAFIGHNLDKIGDGTVLYRSHLFQFVSLLITHRQVELCLILVLFGFCHWQFFTPRSS